MRPGPSARELRAQSLVVLEGELELHQRGIDRPDRFHAMATEVVRGTLDPLPVRTVTGFPPPACTSSTRGRPARSEEHTSELQSRLHLVCRLLLEKKKKKATPTVHTITRT